MSIATLLREPAIANFRAGTFEFTLITMHSIFGDTKAERKAEAEFPDEGLHRGTGADPDEQDVSLLRDFNLPPEDTAFADRAGSLMRLITGTRHTTISENAKCRSTTTFVRPRGCQRIRRLEWRR